MLYFDRSINATEQAVELSEMDETNQAKQWTKWFKDPRWSTPHSYTKISFQAEAYQTWKNYYQPEAGSRNQITSYVNGTLACFCEKEYEKNGLSTAYE
jgi:hypothetical protein